MESLDGGIMKPYRFKIQFLGIEREPGGKAPVLFTERYTTYNKFPMERIEDVRKIMKKVAKAHKYKLGGNETSWQLK